MALNWLAARLCIRLQDAPKKAEKKVVGRKKSPVYLVNPHLYESQNCQNRGSVPSGYPPVDSGDFAMESGDLGGKEVGDGRPSF